MNLFDSNDGGLKCFPTTSFSSSIYRYLFTLITVASLTIQANAQVAVIICQPDNSVTYTGEFNEDLTVTDTHELWGAGTAASSSSTGMPVYASFYLGYQGTLNGSLQVELQQSSGSVTVVGSGTIVPSSGNITLYNMHLINSGSECVIQAGSYYWLHIYSSTTTDKLTSLGGGAPYWQSDPTTPWINNIYQIVTAESQTHFQPVIFQQPSNQFVEGGSNAFFQVVAEGKPSANYQWQFNALNIAGQTTSSLALTNVQFTNAGGYSVIATNAYGSVTSAVAQLTVFTNLGVVQNLYVPANAQEGITFTALSTGIYEFTVTGGAYNNWGSGSSEGGWWTGLYFYVNKSVQWVPDVPNGLMSPGNYNYVLGNWNLQTSQAAAAATTIGQVIYVPLNKGDYLTISCGDDEGFYSDNSGGMNLTASLLQDEASVNITTQPQSLTAQAGSNVTFSVVANGWPSPNYKWELNGGPIAGATNTSLSLTNLQITETGYYSVVVYNDYGSATSSIARLIVYLPPTTPPPTTPSSFLTTVQPPPNLIAAPRTPTSAQLVVFPLGAFVNSNKKTIVLTHGWHNTSSGWPSSMAATLIRNGFGTSANILLWDWTTNANLPGPDPVSLAASSNRTLSEGEALGSALLATLGAGYNLPIHFIGHSLGTMVNCHAADYIHGDDPLNPGHTNSAQKFDSNNTQMTLFDEAELANTIGFSYGVALDILFGPQIAALAGVNRAAWNKVIPSHSAWVDNYISLVGLAHSDAANVLLWRNIQLGLPAAHGYSIQWYSNSIVNPSGDLMGHCWSSEHTLSGAPVLGSCFAQALHSDPPSLDLVPMDSIGETLDVYPSLQAFRALSALGNSTYGIYVDAIQYSGNFVANVAQEFAPPSGQPVLVGAADSTPAYYLSPPSSEPYRSGYTLQFTLQSAASSHEGARGSTKPEPKDSGGSATNSVYAWVPVNIPGNAVALSFQFQLTGTGADEYITMGILTNNYFALESKFIPPNSWTESSVMDISKYAGQQVQLFFSLNGDGMAPSGQLSVRAIQFYTMSPPVLSISSVETNVVLSWPFTALSWQLEATEIMSSTNYWTILTNIPVTVNYQNVVTNILSSQARFYRLIQQ